MRQDMENKTIYYERKEDVGIITLNRPEVLNAENIPMQKDMLEVLDLARNDVDAKVIMLKGEGRSFCAGGDVKAPPAKDVEDFRSMLLITQDTTRKFIKLGKPIIGLVQGYAVGGGCEWAMNCDIRIAAENARFGFAEPNVGGIVSNAATQLLPRLIGLGRALELLYTGEFIDAQEAWRIGLVNKVVPLEDLDKAGWEMAKKIASYPYTVGRAHRTAVYLGMEASFDAILDYEVEIGLSNWATGAREALHAAWREARKK